MVRPSEPDPPILDGKRKCKETECQRLGIQQAAEESSSSLSSLPSSIRRAMKKARNTVKKAGSAVKKLTQRQQAIKSTGQTGT